VTDGFFLVGVLDGFYCDSYRPHMFFYFLIGLLFVAGNVSASTNSSPEITGSRSCQECHQKFYQLWRTSFHGLAMQPHTAELAKTQLTPQTNDVVAGKYRFRADLDKGVVIEKEGDKEHSYPMTYAMGGKNVFYFLTPLDRGWLQVLPVAYDVRRKSWYDTTASAMRHFGDRTDEALYWKERQLTFNSSCFNCHVSQLSKNFDLKTDSYHTTWVEPGINCETCHNPGSEHVKLFRSLPKGAPVPDDIKLVSIRKLTNSQRNDLCATCHAKASAVSAGYKPGDRFFDHFDLTTLEDPDFYPDGRDLGENYTETGWRMSPCAKSGQLDCVHCHTSSGRYRFKDEAKANSACLPCHAARVNNAPMHTHHKAGSPGNRCISCHMPMTEFARMRRTDHSMLPPTPATTIAYKSPNACNICHTNQTPEWADQKVREWHKDDYQKPVLARAALIAAARAGNWEKLPAMLDYLSSTNREEIETTSLVRLLRQCPEERKWPVLRQLTNDVSPLVRGALADALAGQLDAVNVSTLIQLTGDDYRLVRVRAANAIAGVPESVIPEADRVRVQAAVKEQLAALEARPDAMGALYNLGNFYMERGQITNAIAAYEGSVRLWPALVAPYVNVAMAYSSEGANKKAEASLQAARKMEPTNAVVNLNLGMLLAELDKMGEAEQAFRTAFKSEAHGALAAQAAYNLGVMLAKAKPAESLDWCQHAVELRPQEPKYVAALVYFQQQQGKTADAIATLKKAAGNAALPEDARLEFRAQARRLESK
jgi:Tfp pilus assembly protein PilF